MLPRPTICGRPEELTIHERKNLGAILQELLDTVHDAADGYEAAAETVNDRSLSQLFREFAEDRRSAVAELQTHLADLGQSTTPHPSVAAGVHRHLIAFRGALAGGLPAAILSECERGEHFALERFERALNLRMPERVASTVLDHAALIRRARTSFERMRHPW